MPFDAKPSEEKQLELFRKRREAAAALWRAAPRKKFDLRRWECGSTACALGWLAMTEHDGWKFSGRMTLSGQVPERQNSEDPFSEAALYFGMTRLQALTCFAAGEESEDIYGCSVSRVTPDQVADVVLAMPYTVP